MSVPKKRAKSPKPRSKPKSRPKPGGKAPSFAKRPRGELLYGRQGVRESLRAGRRHFHELYLAHGLKQNDVV